MDLIRRLRYSGYLEQVGITEREPGEVFEKLIDHLAAKHEWSRAEQVAAKKKVSTPTSRGSDRVTSAKKKPAKKSKTAQPEPDKIIAETVKLHYVIDRRDFLEKAKSVYAAYA